MKKPEEIPSLEEPNVYVWVFQHGLQSGQHYVYDTDVLLLTLKLLKDQASNQLKEDYKDWLRKKERLSSVLKELFENPQNTPEKTRPRRKSKAKDATLAVSTHTPREFQLILSEYDKFILVEKLYNLPDDHEYMLKFRTAKDVLDAGYMSDRLNEAHKMFRDIYTISIIPSQERVHFLEDTQQFCKRHNRNEKGLYTHFKKEVLSKFVVQIPLSYRMIDERNLQRVGLWVRDLPDLDDLQRKRLQRWCQDVYFADCRYNSQQGISLTELTDKDAAII